ncbi:uncharacterized protein LOC128162258 [Crassostrea angulata]|uniref:uncharacterized protein LOC128162258 n=1 Tax=Magallana angulata TaxID=2784310 RepID=UPI0022B1931A|nr:uncharacterized protein LOC128162258 [Crassostrea angulata]
MENTVKFCIVFLILFQPVVPIDSKFCNGINGKLECCTGYKLNLERNNCIPCDRGFLGENCVTKCPYPTYGEDCQSECNCNVSYCDHVSGCTETSEEQYLSHKIVTTDLMNKVNIVESSFSATVENTTIYYYPKKTQSKMSSTLVLAIIGLTVGVMILIYHTQEIFRWQNLCARRFGKRKKESKGH